MDTHTLRMGYISTPLSPMDRSSRQKLNRNMLEVTDVINQVNLTCLQNILPKHKEYTFFFASQRTFSKIDHELESKLNFIRYNKVEITPAS